MEHSTQAPTKYEAERIAAMMRLGCVACATLDIPNVNRLECHHIIEGNRRLGHYFSIPLCVSHHRGIEWALVSDLIETKKRVAISDGRKRFVLVYGTERSLWERVQKKLKLPLIWPVSKLVPRRESHVASTSRMVEDRAHSVPGGQESCDVEPRPAGMAAQGDAP